MDLNETRQNCDLNSNYYQISMNCLLLFKNTVYGYHILVDVWQTCHGTFYEISVFRNDHGDSDLLSYLST